jgi:hypothetical protein
VFLLFLGWAFTRAREAFFLGFLTAFLATLGLITGMLFFNQVFKVAAVKRGQFRQVAEQSFHY